MRACKKFVFQAVGILAAAMVLATQTGVGCCAYAGMPAAIVHVVDSRTGGVIAGVVISEGTTLLSNHCSGSTIAVPPVDGSVAQGPICYNDWLFIPCTNPLPDGGFTITGMQTDMGCFQYTGDRQDKMMCAIPGPPVAPVAQACMTWNLNLAQGVHTITISAPGYQTKTASITTRTDGGGGICNRTDFITNEQTVQLDKQ